MAGSITHTCKEDCDTASKKCCFTSSDLSSNDTRHFVLGLLAQSNEHVRTKCGMLGLLPSYSQGLNKY